MGNLPRDRVVPDYPFNCSGVDFCGPFMISEHVRKSIGTEHTFREIHEAKDLHKKCRELCEEVVEDLKLRNLMGKLVVLKYKTVSFESHTRNQTLSTYSADIDVIHTAAKRLLDFEISAIAPKPLCLRLMGIRVANLTFEDTNTNNDKQIKIKDFLKAKTPVKTTSNNLPTSSSICEELSGPMHVFQDNDTLQNCEKEKGSVSLSDLQPEVLKPTPQMSYICPVCNFNQIKTLTELNSHIDNCLNKAAIKEILAEDTLNKKRKQLLEEKQNTKKKMLLKGERKIEDYFH
ncbi:DNA polymerase kappa [Trichonephila clavipes]|nr:DNA polymerase kappa [Trichonephila clavipes]